MLRGEEHRWQNEIRCWRNRSNASPRHTSDSGVSITLPTSPSWEISTRQHGSARPSGSINV